MTTTINASTSAGLVQTADTSGSLALQTAGTTAVTIDTSQKVGIGTTSPTGILNVKGTGGDALPATSGSTQSAGLITRLQQGGGIGSVMDIGGNGGTGSWIQVTEPSNLATNYNLLLNPNGGYLLVGTTSPIATGKISTSFAGNAINGATFNDTTNASGSGFVIFTVNGTTIGNISRVTTTNAVAYNTTSDERLKSNIADSQSVLDKLMDVKVRQYDWTEGQIHQDYGFIAQELEPVLSGIVSKGKTDEDMWQLDYAKLTPHLVKAIQELKAINDTLVARIEALENK